jgi:hypothetical protein
MVVGLCSTIIVLAVEITRMHESSCNLHGRHPSIIISLPWGIFVVGVRRSGFLDQIIRIILKSCREREREVLAQWGVSFGKMALGMRVLSRAAKNEDMPTRQV